MWYKGKINGAIRFEVKAYENGSEFGIDGGRISKLYVSRNGTPIIWYERGWLMQPVDETSQQILDHLLKQYN